METLIVRKPESGEFIDLVDTECLLPGTGAGECTAPIGYKCPFRRSKASQIVKDDAIPLNRAGMSGSEPLRMTPNQRRPGLAV